MEFVAKVVECVNTFLWDYALLILLLGAGIIYSFSLKFIQVRKFGAGMKALFGNFSLHGGKGENGLSSFQALTTAIAAQVGTGNIAGAATAIASGGPGAIFWMWVSAFFGMATIYAEAVMAQHTRKLENGHYVGGPVYYIKYVFKGRFGKFLAGFFSVAIILALGFMGNMVQSNSIGAAFNNAFHVPKLAVGICVAVIAGIIFIGGIKRIASFTEKIVPIMALLYIIGCLVILVMHLPGVGTAFKDIFVGAVAPQAIAGGALGVTVQKAMRFGVARGLFSNEAGMGSTPHAHATADVKDPCDQGIIAMMGVFIDTFIILTLTALVILSTGVFGNGQTGSELAQSAFNVGFGNFGNIFMTALVNLSTGVLGNGQTGSELAQSAFNVGFGNFGNIFIALCMLFFAFTTIVGWYYFGEVNVRHLFGNGAVKVYAVIVVICVIIGSTLKVDLVWDMADMFNGLMVLPNLIALLGCLAIVRKLTKKSEENKEK